MQQLHIPSIIRQMGEFQNGGNKETKFCQTLTPGTHKIRSKCVPYLLINTAKNFDARIVTQ